MKYNLSKIMLKAWEIYRKYNIKFITKIQYLLKKI